MCLGNLPTNPHQLLDFARALFLSEPHSRPFTKMKRGTMKAFLQFMSVAALFFVTTAYAQRTTTHSDETSNNTTACGTPTASYVSPSTSVKTSCQADFPGANDDATAGPDQNIGANTISFDPAPKNIADFAHDNVDIHALVYSGFGVAPDTGKVFANIVLWHGVPGTNGTANYVPKVPPALPSPTPARNVFNNHLVNGYKNNDAPMIAAQLAYMKRLKIDGIVGNPPGPLPQALPSQDVTGQTKNHDTNHAMDLWKSAADSDSSFLFSVMSDQVMWDENTICTMAGMTPSCVEKVMTCSLDYMATPVTSNFTCVLDGGTYAGGGYFADSHYWKVNGQPVMSYFLDEAHFFASCSGCAVYNNNVPGVTCTGSTDCWQKIYQGIANHISTFSPKPIVINRDNFTHLPTALNGGSFRWFNPTTDQTNQDLVGYDNWLTTASTTNLPVALAGAVGKVDHSQSPFEVGDHIIMDARCGKTYLTMMNEASRFFGPGHPRTLQAIELTTWDDYDEGTEMETGIDNCLSSLSASISGSTLSWNVAFNAPGDQTTLHHYAIFYSTDGSTGQNITELADVAVSGTGSTGSYTYTLPSNLPNPTVIYVKAVGQPMLTNHLSAGVVFAPTPPAPGTGTVTITGWEQSDGNGNCDSGILSIAVNGAGADTPYGPGGDGCAAVFPGFYAQYLANTINQSNPYVSAQWNGDYYNAVITLTARTAGANTNYSLSAGSFSQSYPIFSPPSYSATASGPTLTGGHN